MKDKPEKTHRKRTPPEPKILEINFNISIDLDRARADWREIVRAIAAAALQFMSKEDAARTLERVESFISEPVISPNPASGAGVPPPVRERREMRPGDWIPDRRPTDIVPSEYIEATAR